MIGAFWCKKISLRDKIINALNASPISKNYIAFIRYSYSPSNPKKGLKKIEKWKYKQKFCL